MLLNNHTYYSYKYGTYAPQDLMKEAVSKGYRSLAVTDINNTSACLDMIRTAPDAGIHIVPGVDFRNGNQRRYVALAMNNAGFLEINKHLSEHLHSGSMFDLRAPEFSNVFVIYPISVYNGHVLRENEFIGVSIKDLKYFHLSPFKALTKKMLILQTVSFKDKFSFNAHRLLRAIDCNTLLSMLPKQEESEFPATMPEMHELLNAFSEFPQILMQTEFVLNSCKVEFDYGKLSNKNLKHYTGSAEGDIELLRQECANGLSYRYPHASAEVIERVEKELQVISQMNFASYFLINWDIINYARRKNYYYVGRGSGANSILAYILRITDVDPIELDLYFERFINIYRSNAPDFDMDFSWTDRDDITRYIFDRFGYERTALLGAYNTFQHDAVIRELGKVFGLAPDEIDKLQHVKDVNSCDEISRMVLYYGSRIKGFPSHLSVHSSGIIISEAPILTYSATILPPKGYPTTQYSMLEAEDIGLYKFDILSQRGLGKIKDTLELVKQNKGVEIDIHDIKKFKEDEKIKSLLSKGMAIGCFYVESPAMRMLLTKLKADDYLRLVAASSIIRPGVARSGMMRAYIDRFRNQALRDKARNEIPELYDILEETYGVMVYQEDVIKVAHHFAGLTLAESDYLRRGMSWKFKQRNEFSRVQVNFVKNCRDKGYSEKTISEIWMQIESFANYAFSKGHSASYAVESYQALYLKAYFPVEYMTATLNNGGGFYRRELYIHEAKQHGAVYEYPCINKSGVLCRVEENVIYPGFFMINGMEESTILSILDERDLNGNYTGLTDFVHRVRPGLEQMRLLIRAGCFNFCNKDKRALLWEVHALLQPAKKQQGHPQLFRHISKKWKLPELQASQLENAYDEMELFGFSYTSAFELIKDKPVNTLRAKDLSSMSGRSVCIIGYMVTVKYSSTAKKERMYFGTFLDEDGEWIDTVHFPQSATMYPFTGKGCYEIRGKVCEEYDFYCIEVHAMKRLPMHERE